MELLKHDNSTLSQCEPMLTWTCGYLCPHLERQEDPSALLTAVIRANKRVDFLKLKVC